MNQQAMTERAARAGWKYAEEREQAYREGEGRDYTPVSWEDADERDREEYCEYVSVIAAALGEVEVAQLREECAALWRILDVQGMTPSEIKAAIRDA
jgi:hypothetical protein